MTNAQRWIRRYLATQFQMDTIDTEDVGDSRVRVTDASGASMEFTCNVYGDIMDAATGELIATATVLHTLSEPMREPSNWKNNDAYFNRPEAGVKS